MSQISLYIDKDTLAKIQKAAAKERISISKWVGKNIKRGIKDDYPQGYFDLYDSLTDESFKIENTWFGEDSRRETL